MERRSLFTQAEVEAIAKQVDDIRNSKVRVRLAPERTLLDREDDLKFLQTQQRNYRERISFDRVYLNIYSILAYCGCTEEELRSLATVHNSRDFVERLGQASAEFGSSGSGREHFRQQFRNLVVMTRVIQRTPRIYNDEDDELFKEMLEEETDIPVIDLMRDHVRSKQETLELLTMQIDYLKKMQRDARRVHSQNVPVPHDQRNDQEFESEITEEIPIGQTQQISEGLPEPNFSLADWRVFWTTVNFSMSPHHFVSVPSDSRPDFIRAIEMIRTQDSRFSIPSTSITNALEFHLKRDTLQRALASRMRYGPPELREWVKIKRGDNRILVRPDEEERTMVFFVGHRSSVYERLG
ncbi:hypothetical protein HY405_00195 [Candidatus Microgenomates bacterium]|nr:hypothetical protein [Candidatus Microgenomates bacterium]